MLRNWETSSGVHSLSGLLHMNHSVSLARVLLHTEKWPEKLLFREFVLYGDTFGVDGMIPCMKRREWLLLPWQTSKNLSLQPVLVQSRRPCALARSSVLS
jgi:hypothetical protein